MQILFRPRTARSMPLLQLLAALLVLLALLPSAARAAAPWPSQAVKMVVPFPPGAAPDVVARLVAERLTKTWGQTVIVENRPGAGGIVGMAALTRAAGDSHTIGFVPAAVATLTPHLYKNPQFNLDSDVVPVAAIGTSPMMVAVNAKSDIRTLADLVRHAKAHPGKANFAAAQPNSVPHLTGEMLSRTAGLGLFVVPYSGSQTAVTAVLAGDALLTVDGLPALVEHVKAGKLRALAVTSDKRLPGFEDVPTVAESYPGFESIGWFAIFAPKGVPQSVVEQLNRDVNKMLQEPALIARLGELGVYPRPGSPAAMHEFLQQQRAAFKKVVHDLGLQPQ